MESALTVVPNLFGTRHRFHGRQFFHGQVLGGWFGDTPSGLHLLCILFLLLLHQLHLRPSGIRFQRLRTPALKDGKSGSKGIPFPEMWKQAQINSNLCAVVSRRAAWVPPPGKHLLALHICWSLLARHWGKQPRTEQTGAHPH